MLQEQYRAPMHSHVKSITHLCLVSHRQHPNTQATGVADFLLHKSLLKRPYRSALPTQMEYYAMRHSATDIRVIDFRVVIDIEIDGGETVSDWFDDLGKRLTTLD